MDTLHLELIVVVRLIISLSAESSHVKGETFKSPFTPSSVPSAHFSQQNSREVSNPRLNVEEPGSQGPGRRASFLSLRVTVANTHGCPDSRSILYFSVCVRGSEMFS